MTRSLAGSLHEPVLSEHGLDHSNVVIVDDTVSYRHQLPISLPAYTALIHYKIIRFREFDVQPFS